jgi:hypothetical protein
MNPRDLPEAVAELIIERHEVRSELRGMRQDLQAMPEQIGTATIRALEPFFNRQLKHGDQPTNHQAA